MAKKSRSNQTDAAAANVVEATRVEEQLAARSGARRVIAAVLLIAGVALWWTAGEGRTNGGGAAVAAAVAGVIGVAISVIPATRELVRRAVDRVRAPSPKVRAVVATLLGGVAAYYLLETATAEGRTFRPVIHDEHCYLIQTQMAARGRLWMPHHELGDHFDTFHLITDRVYAVKYGPGTAMLCAPAVWLGVPPGMVCLLLTGASVALLYLVLCQAVDGLAGVVGAMMLPAISSVRRVSIEVLSQAPMLFLMLLAVWAVLHWRRGRGRGWLAVAWAAAGWGMITRPVDGAGLVLALGLAMVVAWWRGRPSPQPSPGVPGEGVKARGAGLAWDVVVAVVAMLPFVVIQLVFDKGITGRWFTLPWAYLAARNDPYDTVSVAPTPPGIPHEPVSVVPRVRAFSEAVSKPAYEAKVALSAVGRLRERAVLPTLRNGLPSPLLLVLLPVSLMALWGRGRWVLVAVLPVYLLAYSRYTYVVTHYVVTVTPALIVMVLVGWDAVAGLWGRTGATAVRVGSGLAMAALSVAALPQVWAGAPADEWDIAPVLRLVDERIGETVRPPAVVLFRAEPGVVSFHIEPTYNTDVAWPDDAAVVRAHDLGPERNRRLFAYYAEQARQRGTGDRAVYLYDLSPATLTQPPKYLGTAGELAAGK